MFVGVKPIFQVFQLTNSGSGDQVNYFNLAVFLMAVVWAISAAQAYAAPQPVSQSPEIEVGVGLVTQTSADYRGATSYKTQGLPLPYLLYRGKFLKADRDGVRGDLVVQPWYELSMSVGAALSGGADHSAIREGMPALDSSVEFGPSLNFNLSGPHMDEGWILRIPARAGLTFSSRGLGFIGYVFDPNVAWRQPDLVAGWEGTITFGAMWADRKNHQYYYSVAPEHATEMRPAYTADAGYSGAYTRLSMYREIDAWRFGFSLRYDNLSGADFRDSPLVETNHYFSLSLGAFYRLWSNF